MLQSETTQKQTVSRLTTEGLQVAQLQELPWIARRLVHKLRNPLSVVLTAASQLEGRVGQPLDEDDIYFLQNIIGASEQLNDILERFDSFAGDRPLDVQACDINALCRQEFDIALTFEKFTTIDSQVHFDKNITRVQGDAELLQSMIRNVILNACESASEVQSGKVSVGTQSHKDTVLIRIEDNGPGISPADIDAVMCPFVTSRPGKTGIGLTIAQTVARRHGGEITIQSLPGTTRVDITLSIKTEGRSRNAVDLDS